MKKICLFTAIVLSFTFIALDFGYSAPGVKITSKAKSKEKSPSTVVATTTKKSKDSSPKLKLRWKASSSTATQSSNVFWLFEKGSTYKGPGRLRDLALVKKFELEENFESCTEQILKVWSKYSEFQGWLLLQGSQCLLSQLKSKVPQKLTLYPQWWSIITKQGGRGGYGLWNADVIKVNMDLAQALWKNTNFKLSFRAEVAESWRHAAETLNKSDRQEVLKVVAAQLETEGEKGWAQQLLEREGISSAGVLAQSTNGKKNGSEKNNSEKSLTEKENGSAAPFAPPALSEEEELYQSFLEQIKQNQLTGAAEKAAKLLDLYPNGVRAIPTQERLFQAYFSLWEGTPSSEQQAQLERCLEVAKLLNSTRVLDWSRQAHRKGDFRGAYRLAKQALLNEEKSPDGAALLYIAGRSAYLTGEYQESISFFDRLIQRHGGYSEIYESKLRRALAYLRLNKNDIAEELLGSLWLEPENKSYNLAALYWLIRVKQKRNADVSDLVKIMQERFALTYYGLKLSSEFNNQKVALISESNDTVIEQTVSLSAMEKKSIDRAADLAQAGWYWAAQSELNNISFNGSTDLKFLWLEKLTEVFSFPQAIRTYNELSDLDPRWRKSNYLKLVFPRPLEHVVQEEAQKNSLHPLLVFSLMRQESAFSIAATSRSQAKGLMQLIPPTANEVAQDLRIKFFDSDQMYHPLTNIKFGTYYLSKVIRQFSGNIAVGLAAYNAGPHRLKKFFESRGDVQNYSNLSQEDPWSDLWIEELPWLETNLYVKSILRNRIIYQLLEQGSFELPNPVWKGLFYGTTNNTTTKGS